MFAASPARTTWPHQVGPVDIHVNSCLFMIIRLGPWESKCADSSLDWATCFYQKHMEFANVYRKFIYAK